MARGWKNRSHLTAIRRDQTGAEAAGAGTPTEKAAASSQHAVVDLLSVLVNVPPPKRSRKRKKGALTDP